MFHNSLSVEAYQSLQRTFPSDKKKVICLPEYVRALPVLIRSTSVCMYFVVLFDNIRSWVFIFELRRQPYALIATCLL